MTAQPRFVPEAVEEAADWQKPVPFDGGPNLPDIAMGDILGGAVGAYVKAVSAELQVPESLPGLLALTVISAAIQRTYEIRPRPVGSYSEPLSFWACVLMVSGQRKSEAHKRMNKPLQLAESIADRKLRAAIDRIGDEVVIREKRVARLRNLIAEADTSEQSASLARELDELRNNEPAHLARPRYFVGDVTPEQAENLLQDQGGRLAIIADEGGIFSVMAGIYSGGESRLDVFLSGHAGQTLRVDRASRSVTVERAALALGLTVQPDLLEHMPDAARRRFRFSGLLARFAWAIPPSTVGRRNVRLHVQPDLALREAYHDRILSLVESPEAILERVANPPESDEPKMLTLDAESLEVWLQYQERLEPRMADGGDLEAMRDWGGKAPGMALRAAALIHAARHGLDVLTVGAEVMNCAVRLVEDLELHARALLDSLGADQASADARRLFGFISREIAGGTTTLTKTDLNRAAKGAITGARLDKAIQVLQDRAILGAGFSESTSGRPRMLFPINPNLLGA
ncbi:MAG: DUF3987 domain-containing protein [Zoogloeaceae bacterium]|nr:DUF3987 domain-containing protein [Zoogloeaceae bacterium]